MALISYPLTSNFMGNDTYGNPIFDRAVSSVFYRTREGLFWKNGVFYNPSTNFAVTPADGMTVSVQLGPCFIQGLTCLPDDVTQTTLTLDPSGTSVRTDRIVIRADFENNRITTVEVRKGWTAGSALTRNNNIWELAIADIRVRANALSISASDITDLRLNTDLCGTVLPRGYENVDTTPFFNQINGIVQETEADWAAVKNQQSGDFNAFMDRVSSQFAFTKLAINTWFSGIQADLALAAGFDFWNVARMPGNYYVTTYSANGVVTTIKKTSDDTLIAVGATTYSEASVVYEEILYQADGAAEQRHTIETTTYPGGTIRREVVSVL
jgi:hypothetical protein